MENNQRNKQTNKQTNKKQTNNKQTTNKHRNKKQTNKQQTNIETRNKQTQTNQNKQTTCPPESWHKEAFTRPETLGRGVCNLLSSKFSTFRKNFQSLFDQ